MWCCEKFSTFHNSSFYMSYTIRFSWLRYTLEGTQCPCTIIIIINSRVLFHFSFLWHSTVLKQHSLGWLCQTGRQKYKKADMGTHANSFWHSQSFNTYKIDSQQERNSSVFFALTSRFSFRCMIEERDTAIVQDLTRFSLALAVYEYSTAEDQN